MAAGLTPAYEAMAEEYGIITEQSSFLTSSQIAVLGVAPLLWVPSMNTYGRKTILSFSAFACCVLNIGGGFCKSLGSQMITSVLVAFFIATAAAAAGSSVVSDLSFSSQRGMKNGFWSMALIIVTPSGPFFTGFIQQHAGTKYIYFTFAVMNFIQFICWALSRETVYIRGHNDFPDTTTKKNFASILGLHNRTGKKLTLISFFRPLKQALNLNLSMAVIAASVTFCYANIVLVFEMPQAFGVLFSLSPQQLSLHYIALILGSAIGEILAGSSSDWWMSRCIKLRRGKRIIVDRL